MTRSNKQSPVRVLFVDHTAKIGGGEIALLNLVRSLDGAFVYPIVLLFAEGPLAERMRLLAETHVLPVSADVGTAAKDQLGWKSLLQMRAVMHALRHVFKVARFASNVDAQIVHTNSLKADIIGGLAGRLAGIPVIWHIRDRIDSDYLPSQVVRIFRKLSRIIPSYVIANSAATLATLHLTEEERLRARVVHNGCRSVVHDGCNVDSSQQSAASERGVRIGLIGRISPWKGQHIFIQAAALIHRRYPAARFEIIGAPLFSEVEYESQLHELCRTLDLTNVVQFAGFVEDVPARVAQLDIVVHASTTGEPFGQVIIEAMAGEKPVVATNGGGVPEIVQDGITGLLVPMGDVEKMAEALDYLLANPDVAHQMGQEGRSRVLANFTIQRTARMVESVYREVLGFPQPTETLVLQTSVGG
jgi:glycosyltransferase involved in cell wall biosynthesis